jgi:hypothetical protein
MEAKVVTVPLGVMASVVISHILGPQDAAAMVAAAIVVELGPGVVPILGASARWPSH